MSRYTLVADKAKRGIGDYIERTQLHTTNAQNLQRQRTTQVSDDEGVLVQWNNPQDLRLCMHEHELAQECMELAQVCQAMFARAQMRHYQHSRYCEVRTQELPALSHALPALSLREVSNIYANEKRTNYHSTGGAGAPPGLATCHASNAPGLVPVADQRQVRLVT